MVQRDGVARPDPGVLDRALQAARNSETGGFTALYRALAGDIAAFCRARGMADVDDLVNEVFLGAFRGLPRFDGDGSAFRSYLYGIARNKIFDARRKVISDARHLVSESVLTGVPADERFDTERAVLGRLDGEGAIELLAVLTDDQREVILLRFLADLPILEVASITNRPVSAVKALQRRALATLRRNISPPGGIPEADSEDTCG